jgi:hypothetical protein
MADCPRVGRALVATVLVVVCLTGSLGCDRDAGKDKAVSGEPPIKHSGEPSWPTSLPGTSRLPFPPNEIERTWPVGPDKTLIALRVGEPEFDICYLLAAEGDCRPIVGVVSKAEVRSVSPTAIEFICHGTDDTPFVAFPYLLIYDVPTGKTERCPLFRDPRQPTEFGFEAEKGGRLLSSVSSEQGTVEVQFGTAPKMLAAYAGPVGWVPRTFVQWDSERGGLTLCFRGTDPVPEVVCQVAGLAGGCLLGASLERSGGDTLLLLRLDQPRDYYITHSYGVQCTMTVHFAQ